MDIEHHTHRHTRAVSSRQLVFQRAWVCFLSLVRISSTIPIGSTVPCLQTACFSTGLGLRILYCSTAQSNKRKSTNSNPSQKRQKPRPTPGDRPQHLQWKLSSGTVVEEVLQRDKRHLASKFIVDLSDENVQKLFEKSADWEEIKKAAAPRIDPRPIPSLGDFSSLRTTGLELMRSDDEFDVWLGFALFKLFLIYKDGFLDMSHGERTYDCIWTDIIDRSLNGTGLYVTRGELESTAIKELRNKGRTIDDRIRNSPKFDGIIKSYKLDNIEYGFLEVSKDTARNWDSKLLKDELKMIEGMRASLVSFSTVVQKESDFRNQKRVSVQTSRLSMRIMIMVPGRGMVMLIDRRPPVELPQKYCPEKIHKVLLEAAAIRDILCGNNLTAELMDGWVEDNNSTFRLPF